MTSSASSGCLFVVSTPIGNLGDITRRAVEVLREVGCVVAEDTRRTRALLSHLEIAHKDVRALHAHSSPEAVEQLVLRLESGERMALVTDAGTPAVSDPGRALVSSAAERGIAVRVVPGPSAVTAAVALSGLVEGPFAFWGFLPRAGAARQRCVERLRTSAEPVVLFEAPPRMAETLRELAAELPERPAFVGRELTKLHEEGLRGSLRELAARGGEWRGEIVMVIAPAGAEPEAEREQELRRVVDACLRAALHCGVSASRMARALSEASGLSRRDIYQRALQLQGEELRAGEPQGGELPDGAPERKE